MKNVKYSELDSILVLKSYNPIFKISKYLGKRLTGSSLKRSVLQSYRCLISVIPTRCPRPYPCFVLIMRRNHRRNKKPRLLAADTWCPGLRVLDGLRWCGLVWAVTWPRPRRHFPEPRPWPLAHSTLDPDMSWGEIIRIWAGLAWPMCALELRITLRSQQRSHQT